MAPPANIITDVIATQEFGVQKAEVVGQIVGVLEVVGVPEI
jgi:hypothetical protein